MCSMIREILQDLMSKQCIAMANDWSRCHKKGRCDGHCPDFLIAAMDLEGREEYLTGADE